MIYFTVGPSQVYPTLFKHIQSALKEEVLSMNHRGPAFKELFVQTTDDLRKLLGIPKSSQIFFLGSALECMERIIQNTVNKESFHIITGAFSKKFYQTAVDYQKKATSANYSEGIKIPKQAEVICLTENETSTGFRIPMEEIHLLKKTYPDKLIAIDVVSSVPYPKIDFNQIDLVFFSVQKGFGLPAGLAVLVVSEKALKQGERVKHEGGSIGSHHSFASLLEKAQIGQTPATPNVLGIYLLNKVVKDMLKVRLQTIRQETQEKANLLYDFFDKMEDLKPAVEQPKYRSQTTIVVNTFGKTKEILERLAKRGIIISKGYGDQKETQIRIANFPAHKLSDVKKLLSAFK